MIEERTDASTDPADGGPDDPTAAVVPAGDDGPAGDDPEATPAGDGPSELEEPSGPSSWLPWTVAAAALVLALVAVLQWQSAVGTAADRDAAGRTAAEFVTTLTTWDAADGLDDTYEALIALAADEFVAEVDTVFGQQERVDAEASSALSQGDVVEVLTSDDTGGSVRAAVLVEQSLVSDAQPTPVTARRTALVDLTSVDGEWRVAGLELLSELVRPVEGG